MIAASALFAVVRAAAPCVGFAESIRSPFLSELGEWIRNGDHARLRRECYCPSPPSLMRCGFMKVGTALTPSASTSAASAIDLDANVVVCQRRTTRCPTFATRNCDLPSATASRIFTRLYARVMIDNTCSWLPMPRFQPHVFPGNHWSSVSHVASGDLSVGTLVRFGILAHRDLLPGTTDLSDSRCQLRVLIFSRDGTSSPL